MALGCTVVVLCGFDNGSRRSGRFWVVPECFEVVLLTFLNNSGVVLDSFGKVLMFYGDSGMIWLDLVMV